MGLFDGIENASSSQGGQYIKPGQHVFEINALKMPPNLRNGACFIAELTVIASTGEHGVGDSVSWVRNISKHKEMALGDIKAFLAACVGCKEEDVDAAGAEAAVSEAQPMAGIKVACEAFDKPMQKDPTKMFTHTRWSQHKTATATA